MAWQMKLVHLTILDGKKQYFDTIFRIFNFTDALFSRYNAMNQLTKLFYFCFKDQIDKDNSFGEI